MIYFMQPPDGGPVKIGTAVDVESRRRSLERHYKTPLVVLHELPGGKPEEREMHVRFAHLRFGRTEQFRPAADLMAFIGLPLFVSANPDAVEAMPVETKPIRLDLSPETHRHLRVIAAYRNKSMATYAREIIERIAKEKCVELGIK